MANAGEDNEILLPLEGPASTFLNGNLSTDDEKITSYSWVQVGLVHFIQIRLNLRISLTPN